jgi:hypothetical protein
MQKGARPDIDTGSLSTHLFYSYGQKSSHERVTREREEINSGFPFTNVELLVLHLTAQLDIHPSCPSLDYNNFLD